MSSYLNFLKQYLPEGQDQADFTKYFDILRKRDPDFDKKVRRGISDNPFATMQKYLKKYMSDRPNVGANAFKKFFKNHPSSRDPASPSPSPAPQGPSGSVNQRGSGFKGSTGGGGNGMLGGGINPGWLKSVLYG